MHEYLHFFKSLEVCFNGADGGLNVDVHDAHFLYVSDHDYVHEHDDVRPLHDDSDDVPHILLFQR